MNDVYANDDLIQETLLVVLDKYETMDFEKGIIPWAYKILDQKILDHIKKGKRRSGLLDKNMNKLRELYLNNLNFEDSFETQDLYKLVQASFQRLNDTERNVMKLKFLGFSRNEIMERLHMKAGTFDACVSRAYHKIRKELAE